MFLRAVCAFSLSTFPLHLAVRSLNRFGFCQLSLQYFPEHAALEVFAFARIEPEPSGFQVEVMLLASNDFWMNSPAGDISRFQNRSEVFGMRFNLAGTSLQMGNARN